MRERNLIIGAVVSIVIIIGVAVFLAVYGPSIKTKKKVQNVIVEESANIPQEEEQEKSVLIANLNRKEDEPEPEQKKDATVITQDIQGMDIDIGKLVIPRTGLSTQVYCKQNANKMENVPCMLYTNEGPNQPGVTVLVGHNRNNGLLFSDNNKIEENDELFFTDYINNEEKRYIVTSKFVTDSLDVSFYNEQSDKPIIYMQCCLTPTDGENVLKIKAEAE